MSIVKVQDLQFPHFHLNEWYIIAFFEIGIFFFYAVDNIDAEQW